MSFMPKPIAHHPALPRNAQGLTRRDYEGTMSTLCAGCGHDSITAALIEACFEMDLAPHRIAKVSGIGCSSKAPTYFLSRAHGFNSVHGRMPSVTTGAALANRDLVYIGVSGDGDTASIGLGQFCHCRAAAAEHDLHRHEQRLLRPHQGPVLGHQRQGLAVEEGRGQPVRRHRPVPDGDPAGRRLRRPLVLRRQGAADPAHQGGHQLQRLRPARRGEPLRHLQQPPDLHQELRLRAGPQHGLREAARLRGAEGGDHGRLRRGRYGRHRAARRLAPPSSASSAPSTTRAMPTPRS